MITMPRQGQPAGEVLSKMRELREQDARWQDGRKGASLILYHNHDLWEMVLDVLDGMTAVDGTPEDH